MNDEHSTSREHIGRRSEPSIDAVHTERYDDLVNQILNGQIKTRDTSHPLSSVLETSLDIEEQGELDAQAEAEKMLQDFEGQFIFISEGLRKQLDSLEVVYSEEENDYLILSYGGNPLNLLSIDDETLQDPYHLYIPSRLRCMAISISNCTFMSMDPVPKGTRGLTISRCEELEEIPVLPESLKTLDCFTNKKVRYLPDLRDGLEILRCSGNAITHIPKLPDHLTELRYGSPELTVHPQLDHLEDLRIVKIHDATRLDHLPDLPETIHELEVIGCTIHQPMSLPSDIEQLTFEESEFGDGILANFPDKVTSLTVTRCKNIDTLPDFPGGLVILNCSGQYLTELPAFPPNLMILNCHDCGLKFLPPLPDSLGSVQYYGNDFSMETETELSRRNMNF